MMSETMKRICTPYAKLVASVFVSLMFFGIQPSYAGSTSPSSSQTIAETLGEKTTTRDQFGEEFDQIGWPARGHFDPFPDFTKRYVDSNRSLWQDLGLFYHFQPTIITQRGTHKTRNHTANYQHNILLGAEVYRDTPVGSGYFIFNSLYVTQLTSVSGVNFAAGLGINFFTSDSVAETDAIKALLWQHDFPDGVFTFSLGHVGMSGVDVSGCSYTCDDTESFLATPLSASPTGTLPGDGFGLTAEWQVVENVFLEGSVGDARGDGKVKFGRAFRNDEFAYAGAVKLINPFPDLGDGFYKLSFYHVDATRKGTPAAAAESQGFSIVAEQDIGDVGFFARYRHVFGRKGQARETAAAGAVWKKPFGNDEDWWGFGLGWVNPSAANTNDEYVAETFYRAQLTPFVRIGPDLQLIINSSANPSDLEAVASLRVKGHF